MNEMLEKEEKRKAFDALGRAGSSLNPDGSKLLEAYHDVSRFDIKDFVDHMIEAYPSERNGVLKAMRILQISGHERKFGEQMTALFTQQPELYAKFLAQIVNRQASDVAEIKVGCNLLLGMEGLDEKCKGECREKMQEMESNEMYKYDLNRMKQMDPNTNGYIEAKSRVQKIKLEPLESAAPAVVPPAQKSTAVESRTSGRVESAPPAAVTQGKREAEVVLPSAARKFDTKDFNEKELSIINITLCVSELDKINNESVKGIFKDEIIELMRQKDDEKNDGAAVRLTYLNMREVQHFVQEVNRAISADRKITYKDVQPLMLSKNTPGSINVVFSGVYDRTNEKVFEESQQKEEVKKPGRLASFAEKAKAKLGGKKDKEGMEAPVAEQDAEPKKEKKGLLQRLQRKDKAGKDTGGYRDLSDLDDVKPAAGKGPRSGGGGPA
ncbi:MAG TPA: hypothetical protein VGV92_00600 [Gammaproteobacteria bacterium]|nr:hypothetical protein [Gammaproteobacteria bacterium]